jgi:hypothetical protein
METTITGIEYLDMLQQFRILQLDENDQEGRIHRHIDPRSLGLGTSWRCVVSLKPRALYPRGKRRRGGWVGPRADLDAVNKRKFFGLLGLKLQTLGCPSCS